MTRTYAPYRTCWTARRKGAAVRDNAAGAERMKVSGALGDVRWDV